MAKRRKTANYYNYEARLRDIQAAQNYCDSLPEDLAAAVISSSDNSFLGLVIHSNDEPTILDTNIAEHPLAREGESRLTALTAAHQAYLGSLILERQQKAI